MRLVLLIIVFFMPLVCQASLSPIENQIRNYVDRDQPSQLNQLQQLVNINSGTNNHKGVIRVGEKLRPQFAKLGFKTYWVSEPPSFNRAPTLVAEHTGTKGKRILMIGHLDTVFPANSSFQNAVLTTQTMKGPGTVDDKGGVVVIMSALKALNAARVLDKARITVVLTGDEEDSGKPGIISRRPLIEAAKKSDIALDFEEVVSMDTVSIARRGISAWSVKTKGIEAHSSSIFKRDSGAGAIFELARIINTMRTELHHLPNITYNPGLILGGTTAVYDPHASAGTAFGKTNVIAKTAMAKGDFRYLNVAEREDLKNRMRKIVENHLPGTNATIDFQDGIPAMPPKEGNLALMKEYSKVSEDLGQGKLAVLDPNDRGAGDISYIAEYVPQNLVGIGPLGYSTHSAGETLELASLKVQTERAAVLLYRLSL